MKRMLLLSTFILISSAVFSQTIYSFNGNGNWSDSTNWVNRLVPPGILMNTDSIFINPTNLGECVLDISQTITKNSSLTIAAGKNFRILGSLVRYDSQVVDTQLREGLIAYYPFNNNANDESGNSNNLSVQGATPSNDRFGESSKAYLFNGINSSMKIPKISQAENLSSFTISLWIKPTTVYENHMISFQTLDSGNRCTTMMGIFHSNLEFKTEYGIVYSNTLNSCSLTPVRENLPDLLNKWSNLVLTARRDSINSLGAYYVFTAYFNGQKLNKQLYSAYNPDPISFNHGGVIGCKAISTDFPYDFFDGNIDDIRIYKRELSEIEILQLYRLTY